MMATSARAYNAGNVMLMRSESTSADTLVAMLASCGASGLQGARSVGGLEEAVMGGGQKRPFYPMFDTSEETGDDDAADDCNHHVEKKRRLTVDQVRSLEKNFELENKLEPERKMQLARELGLQPRQVAVWFQNRRARWKTKQLERDYDVLKLDYDTLKSDYDSVVEMNRNLKAEIHRLSKLETQVKHPKLDGKVFETDELDVSGDLGTHLEMTLKSEPGGVHHSEDYDIELTTGAALTASMNHESPVKSKGSGGSTSSESNSSEIMNADSPHPIDSGVSPGVDHKTTPFVCSQQQVPSSTDTTIINVEQMDNLADDLCGRLVQRPVKVEDGVTMLQEECNQYTFYNMDDSGMPWWPDWA